MNGISPQTLLAVQSLAEEASRSDAKERVESARQPGALAETTESFEAVFLSQMLSPMFDTLEEDPLFGGGPGEKMYRSLLVEEYGKILANTGGVGLAEDLQHELLRLQETKS